MRLAAVYIPKNSLPYIFGENHKGQTFNLGGAYRYTINEEQEGIKIDRNEKIQNFFDQFWGSDISLITAIVGRNGVGKTTLLRAINHSVDKKNIKAFYLFEKDDDYIIYNELPQKNIKSKIKYTVIDSNAFNVVKHYFSPITDFKLLETKSPYNIVYDGNKSLNEIYLKQINKNVHFLNSNVLDKIKEIYTDFPKYDRLEISVPKLRKFDFKNIYGTSNLGSQDRAQVLRTYIDSDIADLKKEEKTSRSFSKHYTLQRLEAYIQEIDRKGLNSLFDDFWGLDEYKATNNQDEVHDGDNFLKNFEILLISYLIVGATFPVTSFQGGHNKELILETNSFKERLNGFLELYLANDYGRIRNDIKEKLGKIDISDYQKIKEILQAESDSTLIRNGFKAKDAVRNMVNHLEKFKCISEFYSLLKNTIDSKNLNVFEGKLFYDIKEDDLYSFNKLISKYNDLLANFGNSVMNITLLSFESDKILSSGENALLNFYARIYDYLERIRNRPHQCFDYYLLLLDEPELGYHPYWKKKFINAIVNTLPTLFETIKPSKSVISGKDIEQKNNPLIQIIFTTHDPLTLSDIPNSNILYLDKDKQGNTFLLDKLSQQKKSFGANIHDLLADSFFLHNGFMGEFAEETITDLINYLEANERDVPKDEIDDLILKRDWNKELAQKVINIVDEPFIKERLQNLFDEKYFYNNRQALLEQRNLIDKRLSDLEDEKN